MQIKDKYLKKEGIYHFSSWGVILKKKKKKKNRLNSGLGIVKWLNCIAKTGKSSREHAYIILTPLNPLLYSKTGLQGYTLIFLFLLKNIDCGYSLEPPQRGGSNEHPQSMF